MEQLYELNLRDYWAIFLKRKWEVLLAFLVVFFSTFTYTYFQESIYRATVLLKIESSSQPSDVIFPGSYRFPQPFELSDYTKQVVSGPVMERAARELGWLKEGATKKEVEALISDISAKISAAEIEKSNMIRLYTYFPDATKAADFANKVAEVFKRMNVEQKNESTRNVRIFIEDTLANVSEKLKELEAKLRVLTTRGAIGLAVTLLQQITDLDRRITDLSTKFTEKYPPIVNLQEERVVLQEKLKSLPKEEFEYGILQRDIKINENLYNSLKQHLQTARIKEAEKTDNIIIVNPAIVPKTPYLPDKKRNYIVGVVLGLVLGIAAALVSENLDTSIGRVDDIESFIKIGVIGIIPYCTEYYKGEEKRDKGKHWFLFKKEEKVRELKPTYILGLEKSESTSLFLEAFRLLGVNLQVLFGQNGKIKNKIILITSSKPEEGKTVIVSSLGVIMAQMGYKVLVLDADIRRAHIHKSFGLKGKENGLLDILTGKISFEAGIKTATDIMLGSTSIDRIIEKPWLNNLNIVTAGGVFPNTIALFNSTKMDEILQYFRNRYDVVLVDSSPILAVSEPSILLPKVDGVLMAYRAGFTSRLALRRAKLQIEGIKGKNSLSGIILNNVTPEIGMTAYYYYYSRKYYGKEKEPSDKKTEEGGKDV